MKSTRLQQILIIFLLSAALFAAGCGGGGGGGGSSAPAAASNSTATISSSNTAKNFIAREIAGVYSTLDNYAGASQRASRRSIDGRLKAAITSEPGIGHIRVTYNTEETLNLWGVNYTYHTGYQDLIVRDSSGNPTGNENLVDSLEISSVNMGCRINDAGNIMNLVYNGKLVFSGLLNATTFTIRAQNLNIAGNINSIDQINWTINGNVSVSQSSYPYPVSGSTENGTLIFNGNTYYYTTNYNGSNIASINFSGAENFTLRVNLATGAAIETSYTGSANLVGSWKLIAEDREGIMLAVQPNDSGKVSVIHFYSNNSFKSESIERFSNSSINYWQTYNLPAEVMYADWQINGSQLTLQSGGQSVQHTVIFSGSNQFTQVNPFGEKYTWQKI